MKGPQSTQGAAKILYFSVNSVTHCLFSNVVSKSNNNKTSILYKQK